MTCGGHGEMSLSIFDPDHTDKIFSLFQTINCLMIGLSSNRWSSFVFGPPGPTFLFTGDMG